MTSFLRTSATRLRAAPAACLIALACGLSTPLWAQTSAPRSAPRTADYIVAVVNQELVTAAELQARFNQVKADAQRSGSRLPSDESLRAQVLDMLIDERVQVTHARDSGLKVDDTELDRAVASVAQQNGLNVTQLRARLREEGVDYTRFRNNVRDQLMIERIRDREVQARIRVSDAEVEELLAQQRATTGGPEINVGNILVAVPEGASAEVVAERKARAESALSHIQAGAPFKAVAAQVSDDPSREQGGAMGLRAPSRVPEVFLKALAPLKAGEVLPELLRTGAGFHILMLIERHEADGLTVTQTRSRHILMRPNTQQSDEAVARRLGEFKQQVVSGSRSFESLAREFSEDGSAAQGGDLGFLSPGVLVPEFEEPMNRLPLNGVSDPVQSRFGWHLIQVLERRNTRVDAKQLRDRARGVLRERKFEQAAEEWMRELRARAYIEMREAPN